MRVMLKYLVRFYKRVSDDTGHEHDVLQRQTLICARSEVSALYEAKARFCETLQIADWRLRADTCEILDVTGLAA